MHSHGSHRSPGRAGARNWRGYRGAPPPEQARQGDWEPDHWQTRDRYEGPDRWQTRDGYQEPDRWQTRDGYQEPDRWQTRDGYREPVRWQTPDGYRASPPGATRLQSQGPAYGPGWQRGRREPPSGWRRWLPHRPRRRWAKVTLSVLAAIVVVLAIPTSWSVGRALTMPGGGTVSERLAEWARDHYLGPLVTLGEWISYQPPKRGGLAVIPKGPSAGHSARDARSDSSSAKHAAQKLKALYAAPPRLKSFAGRNLRGEGSWRVLATVNGHPAIFGTYLRASSVYTSYVAGIAVMNQSLVRFELRPGVEDPGYGNWKAQPYITPGTRSSLLATFNGGFKIANSGGGFYLNGTTRGTLIPGVASVVYYRNGRIAIGNWDRTVRMTPDVVGVRQNLHLIVIHSRVPSTVDFNVETSWGATLGGSYYVWRSGIGITKTGRVVFAYGPELNVREIAELLKRAGAVSAMELDINPDWMSYMYYLHGNNPANPRPVNLLPTQMQAPTRYFSLANRDFTAVFAR